MLTSAQILNASFKATISAQTVAPIIENIPVILPLHFDSVANVSCWNGTYTPNNDYYYVFQTLAQALAPNFVIVICDGIMNLTYAYTIAGVQPMVHSRFAFNAWPVDATNFLSSLFIEGRTNVHAPMAQGTPVNYTIITGQANLT